MPINSSSWESNSITWTHPHKLWPPFYIFLLGISSFATGITGLASVSCRGMTTFSSKSMKLSTSSLLPMVDNLSLVFLRPIPRHSRRLNKQKVELEPLSKSTYLTVAQGLALTFILTGKIDKPVMAPSSRVGDLNFSALALWVSDVQIALPRIRFHSPNTPSPPKKKIK